jgi:hypothetical protein
MGKFSEISQNPFRLARIAKACSEFAAPDNGEPRANFNPAKARLADEPCDQSMVVQNKSFFR